MSLEFNKKEQELITACADHSKNLKVIIDADNQPVVFKENKPIYILGGDEKIEIILEKIFNYMDIEVKRDHNIRVLRC